MPNGKNSRPNFMAQTAKILVETAKQSTSDYTSSLVQLKDDAKEIRTQFAGGTKTAKEVFTDIRKNGMKHFVDWFYSGADNTSEYDLENDSDSDFDAGFKLLDDDTDDGSSTPKTKVLDNDGMRDIAKGQVNAMYKIAGKQAETTVMGIAELKSEIVNQGSLIAGSLKSTNETLSSINKNLETLVKLQQVGIQQQAEIADGQSNLSDDEGRFTLKSLTEGIKKAISESQAFGMGSTLVDAIKTAGPAGLLSSIIDMTGIKEKEFGIFGGRSINEMGELFNRTISNGISGAISNIFDSKPFQKIAELLDIDITGGEGNKNYSYYVKNQYTKDKAVFDNMTRESIVNIIPKYLQLITGALTGQNYHVTSTGQLSSGIQTNGWENARSSVIHSIGSGYASRGLQNKLSEGMGINASELRDIGQRITLAATIICAQRDMTNPTDGVFRDAEFQRQIADYVSSAYESDSDKQLARDQVGKFFYVMLNNRGSMSEFGSQVRKALSTQEKVLSNYVNNNPQDPNNIGTMWKGFDESAYSDALTKLVDEQYQKRMAMEDEARERIEQMKLDDKNAERHILQGKYEKRLNEELEKIARQFEQREFGDSYADIDSAIKQGFGGGIMGSIGKQNMEYQNDVTSTLHQILDVLTSGFGGNPVIPEHVTESPSVIQNDARSLNYNTMRFNTVRGSRRSFRQKSTASSDDSSDSDDGISNNNNEEVVSAINSLNEMSFVQATLNTASQDGNLKEDSNIINDVIANVTNSAMQGKLRNAVNKLTRNAGEKQERDENKPKGLFGLLLGGAKKLFSPITKLLRPVTSILGALFKPALELIKKGLKSGMDDVKKGKETIKENSKKLFDTLTGGIVDKIKGKINDKLGQFKDDLSKKFGVKSAEEQGIEGVKEETKEVGEDVKEVNDTVEETQTKIVEKMDETESKRDERHSGLMDMLTSIKDAIMNSGNNAPSSNGGDEITPKVKDGGGGSIGTPSNLPNVSVDDITAPMSSNAGAISSKAASAAADVGLSDMTGIMGSTEAVTSTFASAAPEALAGAEAGLAGGAAAGGTAAAGGAAAAGGPVGIAAVAILGILKGVAQVIMGIGKMVGTAILSLAAIKTLTSLVSKTIAKSIKPINKAIKEITKVIKPVIKQFGGILNEIATMTAKLVEGMADTLVAAVKGISKVLTTAMNFIRPILEALNGALTSWGEWYTEWAERFAPSFEEIFPIIEDIGEMMGDFIKTFTEMYQAILRPMWEILAPFIQFGMKLYIKYMMPYFIMMRTLVSTVEMIAGSIEINVGQILAAMGTLLEGVGKLVKWFTRDNSLEKTGERLHGSGLKMIDSGIDSVMNGVTTMFGLDKKKKEDTSTDTTYSLPTRNASSGMNIDGTVTSTYGSGDQASYGSYLNMAKRGCGPIALAEAASRRTGSNVDAKSLALSMAASGNYSTSRGTSVANYLNAANAMGLGYSVGGVNSRSLKHATPNNPITVVGSGSGYGTMSGNTHYVNVIGTKNGIAYTSNPLTGRVERRSVNDITSGALMGLYGSGDISSSLAFSDTVSDLFDELKEKAGGLLSIFSFEDDLDSSAKKAELEEQYKTIKNKLTAEEFAKVESEAYKTWAAKNPKRDNESASSYLSRWKKHETEYVVEVGSKKAASKFSDYYGDIGDNAAETTSQLYGMWDAVTGAFTGGAASLASNILGALQLDATGFSGGGGSAYGNMASGGVLGVIPSVIQAYAAAGVVGNKGDYNQGGRTHVLTINGKSYTERPDCTGLCDTVIDVMGYDSGKMNSAAFNKAAGIKDASGNISPDWVFYDNPALSDFQPGDIGIIYDGGAHHGEIFAANANNRMYGYNYGGDGPIRKSYEAIQLMSSQGLSVADAAVQAGSTINGHHKYTRLLRHVSTAGSTGGTGVAGGTSGVSTPTQGAIDMTTLAPYYKNTWNSYKDKDGIRNYFTAAQQAGMSPAQQALIMATGIWEDNAKKLTGQKSLTHVTVDKNGQRAVGIMNWIPKSSGSESTEYGSTLAEQLNYISQAYFGAEPTRRQGRITQNVTGYSNALAQLAGHAVQGKQGDPIGPIIDRDLIEGSGHYVGGSLVPEGWNTPQGLGKYIGTAVDVYNWMVANGLASGQYSSYAGSAGAMNVGIGANLRELLNKGTLNLGSNDTMNAAFNSALSAANLIVNPGGTLISAATNFALSDSGKEAISTALDTATNVAGAAASGMRDLIKNKITTAGNVVSTWWNGAKNAVSSAVGGVTGAIKEASEIGEDGIMKTLTDMGSSLYEGGTGYLGAVFDTCGNEFQVLYNGVNNDIQIVKGTAEDVSNSIAKGIGGIVGALMQTVEVGDTTEHKKLKNLLSGNYGQSASLTSNAESLLGAFAQEVAQSMGVYNQAMMASSSYGGSYDSSYVDEESGEEASSTIVPGTTDPNYYEAYDAAVDSRMKAKWKTAIDNAQSEWSKRTRGGKNPTGWYDDILTTQRMADYYRTEYPNARINETFSKWYQSKFYKSTAQQSKESLGGITNARLLANRLAYIDSPHDMVQLLYQYPQWANDSRVAERFTQGGYDNIYQQALRNIGVQNWDTASKLTSNGTLATMQEMKVMSGTLGSGDIPALDMNLINDVIGNETQQQPMVVNQYISSPHPDTNGTEWIQKLEDITFNVRAEKVEALLQEISDKLSNINTSGGTTVVQQPPRQVDETVNAIPQQVTRLARG